MEVKRTRKPPNLWKLAGMTYGLVAVTTIIALGAYYYLISGTKPEPERAGNITVGTVWVSMYPGAIVHDTASSHNGDASEGTLKFGSTDPPGTVLMFYRTSLRKSGFQIQGNSDAHTLRAIGRAGKVEVTVSADHRGDGSENQIATIDRQKK